MSGPHNNYNEYWRCYYCDQVYFEPGGENDCLCPIRIKEEDLEEIINLEDMKD